MKKHRIIALFLLAGSAAASCLVQTPVRGQSCHRVEGKEVVVCRGDEVKRIPAGGLIIRSVAVDSGLYYCAARGGDGSSGLMLGFADFERCAVTLERDLPPGADRYDITNMMAGDSAVYLLAIPREGGDFTGDLYRVNRASGDISSIAHVMDFYAQGEDCYLLVKSESKNLLVLNERSIPLSITGEVAMRIREVLDGRLVMVTSGEETEVIDIRAGKSLYQYSPVYNFMEPEDYNLIILAVDTDLKDQGDREMIFYKVIINGIENGRTDSGPAGLAREMRVMLEPNRYHQVRLERWTLNSARGRYDRDNNIRQPRMQQIYMPLNRIVKLVVSFKNKEYSYQTSPVYK